MKKLFCVSDIHGFYDPFIEALTKAGFDAEDPDHWLICCGDCFDRGEQTVQVFEYLVSLPRKVLIRGNHEDLLEECCQRRYAFRHDIHNGTAFAIADLGEGSAGCADFGACCDKAIARLSPYISQLVNYFETAHYIFVHGWIPRGDDWRNASASQWEAARWKNGMLCAFNGNIDPGGKTVVCGHWHTSWGHYRLEKPGCRDEWEHGDFSPYYAKGIIALDACTAYSHKVNVIVLEDEFLDCGTIKPSFPK